MFEHCSYGSAVTLRHCLFDISRKSFAIVLKFRLLIAKSLSFRLVRIIGCQAFFGNIQSRMYRTRERELPINDLS